jgi:undecaprenyl-diphosphatase
MFKKLVEIDHRWSDSLKTEGNGFLLKVSKVLAHSGDSLIWFPLLLIVCFFTVGFWSELALLFLLGAAMAAAVVTLLKYVFRRTRPDGTWGKMYRFFDPHSFPSGHAARVFVIAIISFHSCTFLVACLVLGWAILVSTSRIVAGVHYFSDILAGVFIGILIGTLIVLMH